MVTKTEQIPSRRTASQRDVVRNKNQASVSKHIDNTWYLNCLNISDIKKYTTLHRPALIKSENRINKAAYFICILYCLYFIWIFLFSPEWRSWYSSNICWKLCWALKARIVLRPWRVDERWENTGLRASKKYMYTKYLLAIEQTCSWKQVLCVFYTQLTVFFLNELHSLLFPWKPGILLNQYWYHR